MIYVARRTHKPIPFLTSEQIERFWSRVSAGQPNECWPWTAALNDQGYGVLSINHSAFLASRVALFIATGEDPGELVAMHSCNNPPCCNPTHISGGTMKENTRYAIECGRFIPEECGRAAAGNVPKGEDHYCAKMTERNVQWVRLYYLQHPWASVTALGEMFEISEPSMSEILHRKMWVHVRPVRGIAVLPDGVTIAGRNDTTPRGEGHYNTKLSDDLVREIRKRYAGGDGTTRSLGEAYGLSVGPMHALLSKKTWKHVKD